MWMRYRWALPWLQILAPCIVGTVEKIVIFELLWFVPLDVRLCLINVRCASPDLPPDALRLAS